MPRPGFSPLYQLDFENPILEIERQIDAIEERPDAERYASELKQLNETRESMLRKIYQNLTPWQTVRIARHPLRPQTNDYMSMICRDFCELHGDRAFGDDPAIVTGFARIGSMKCMFIGHNKGKTVAEKVAAHFGCAHPEGYRKAMLKMKLAEKLGLPIVTLVDTPGAYPGLGSEQRGQAQAIAVTLLEMSRLRTPIVSIVIGEGVFVTPAAVSHGSLTVNIKEMMKVSQPGQINGDNNTVVNPGGQTAVTPDSQISVDQQPARTFLFAPGAQLSNIVDAMNAVGASPGDLVAILEALKQSGALHADLIVI